MLDGIIAELGHILLTEKISSFESVVKEKSQSLLLGDEELKHLKKRLHQPPESLAETPAEQLPLGQWIAVCQYVIFELLYNKYSFSIQFIESVAFGKYDWTQATALEVLCRLRVEGKISENIIQKINKHIGQMRYETHLYFGRALKVRGKNDERYIDLFKQITDDEFQKSLSTI